MIRVNAYAVCSLNYKRPLKELTSERAPLHKGKKWPGVPNCTYQARQIYLPARLETTLTFSSVTSVQGSTGPSHVWMILRRSLFFGHTPTPAWKKVQNVDTLK